MLQLGFLYGPKAMDVGMQSVHSLSCQYPCTDDTVLRKNPTTALCMLTCCLQNTSVLPQHAPLRAETCSIV
jgi:hypothetical protein